MLACDGIWDVMSNDETVKFLHQRLGDGSEAAACRGWHPPPLCSAIGLLIGRYSLVDINRRIVGATPRSGWVAVHCVCIAGRAGSKGLVGPLLAEGIKGLLRSGATRCFVWALFDFLCVAWRQCCIVVGRGGSFWQSCWLFFCVQISVCTMHVALLTAPGQHVSRSGSARLASRLRRDEGQVSVQEGVGRPAPSLPNPTANNKPTPRAS